MKKRNYTQEQVKRLQGSVQIEHTLAKRGAYKLRELLANEPYINTLGAYNGQMAVQHAKAGLKAIYLSGWQVAAANNTQNTTYPDQSLYPVDSVPKVVKGINNAFRRADQIEHSEGNVTTDYFLPIVADAEAGFGGALKHRGTGEVQERDIDKIAQRVFNNPQANQDWLSTVDRILHHLPGGIKSPRLAQFRGDMEKKYPERFLKEGSVDWFRNIRNKLNIM